MINLMLLINLCVLFLFAYFLAFTFLTAEDGKLIRILKRVRNNKTYSGAMRERQKADIRRNVSDAASRARLSSRYRAGDGAYGAIKQAVAKLIVLSDGRRDAMNKKLLRAGFNVSVELFYADVILRVLAVYLLIPVFIALDIKAAAAGTVFLGIGLYYKWIGEPDERIKSVSAEIADELPRFVSVLGYSMTTDRDLIRTIERYLKIAKPALRADLELLLLEMKAGNIAEALKRFDERVGNAQLSAFVSGLIDAGRGVDQKTFFYLMEENMRQIFIENRKRELARRPAKVKKAIISAGLCMFLIYLVPICVQLIEGMSMFK